MWAAALPKLIERIKETVSLLEQVREEHWCNWMMKSLRYLENSDYYGIEHLRDAFGGMGSFNDLLISKDNGYPITDAEYGPINDRLDRLRDELYELADFIRRNHEIKG
jgi:hypothetical protein